MELQTRLQLRQQGYTEKEIDYYYEVRSRLQKKANKKKKKSKIKPKYLKKYHRYLRSSKEWATIKIELYASRGKKCEVCYSTYKLQVHHRTYKNIYNEEPSELVILCDVCHKKAHKE
jgi:5-methylcytosine-specific restriction endonuclease McrA